MAAKGCLITVGAKPLHAVYETFGSIPTEGPKCRYLIRLAFEGLARRCEPARKSEKGGGVSTTSSMLKLAKRMKKIRKPIVVDIIAYLFFLVRGFSFILEFILDFWKDNPIMSTIEPLIPYQRPILLHFLRDNISDLMIKIDFPYQRPIPLFKIIVLRHNELRDP